jgi:hypothetical protein
MLRCAGAPEPSGTWQSGLPCVTTSICTREVGTDRTDGTASTLLTALSGFDGL